MAGGSSTLQLASLTVVSLVTGGLIGALLALPVSNYYYTRSGLNFYGGVAGDSADESTTPSTERGGFITNSENSSIDLEAEDERDRETTSSRTVTAPEGADADDEEDYEEDEEDDEEDEEIEVDSKVLNEIPGEVRMTLIIRTDLGMQKGKVAAQCSHAAVSLYRSMSGLGLPTNHNPEMLKRWEMGGQAKITLKCNDEEEMDLLFAQALSLNVNCTIIHDAGRTQIAAGSATVLGLGPAPKLVLDQITKDLKLY